MQNSKSAVKIPPGVPTATTKEKEQINFKFGLNKRKARNFLSQYLKWNGPIYFTYLQKPYTKRQIQPKV